MEIRLIEEIKARFSPFDKYYIHSGWTWNEGGRGLTLTRTTWETHDPYTNRNLLEHHFRVWIGSRTSVALEFRWYTNA